MSIEKVLDWFREDENHSKIYPFLNERENKKTIPIEQFENKITV